MQIKRALLGCGGGLGGRGRGGLSLSGGCRGLLRASGPLLTRAIDLEVGHKLLLLREHGLERVELSLQLLNGDLGLTNGRSRILYMENCS